MGVREKRDEMHKMEINNNDGHGMPTWAVLGYTGLAILFGWIEEFVHVKGEAMKDLLPFLQGFAVILGVFLTLIKIRAELLAERRNKKTTENNDN